MILQSNHEGLNIKEIFQKVKQLQKSSNFKQIQKYLQSINLLAENISQSINSQNLNYNQSIYLSNKVIQTSLASLIIGGIEISFANIKLLIGYCSSNKNLRELIKVKMIQTLSHASTFMMITYLAEVYMENQHHLITILNQRIQFIINQIHNMLMNSVLNEQQLKHTSKLFQILIQSLDYLTNQTKQMIPKIFINRQEICCFIIDIANQLKGEFARHAIDIIDPKKLCDNYGRYITLWELCVNMDLSYLKLLPVLVLYQERLTFLLPTLMQLRKDIQELFAPCIPFIIHSLVPYIAESLMSRIALQEKINQIYRTNYYNLQKQYKQQVLQIFSTCSSFIHQQNIEMYTKLTKQIFALKPNLLLKLDPMNDELSLMILNQLQSCQQLFRTDQFKVYYLKRFKQLAADEIIVKYSNNFNLYNQFLMLNQIQQIMKQKDLIIENQLSQTTFVKSISVSYVLKQILKSIHHQNEQSRVYWSQQLISKQPIWDHSLYAHLKQIISSTALLQSHILDWIILVCISGFHQQQSVIDATQILTILIEKYHKQISTKMIINCMISLIFGNRNSVIMSSGIIIICTIYLFNRQSFMEGIEHHYEEFIRLISEQINQQLFEDQCYKKFYIVFAIYLLSQKQNIEESSTIWSNIVKLINNMYDKQLNLNQQQLQQSQRFNSCFIYSFNEFDLITELAPQIKIRYPQLPISNLGLTRLFFKYQTSNNCIINTSQIRKIYKINKKYYHNLLTPEQYL